MAVFREDVSIEGGVLSTSLPFNTIGFSDERPGIQAGVFSDTAPAIHISQIGQGPMLVAEQVQFGGRAQLGGTDPVFHQHAGVYGQSDQQGVIGLTTQDSGTGVYGGGASAPGSPGAGS